MFVKALLLFTIPDQSIPYLIDHNDILTRAFIIHLIVFAIFSTETNFWFFSQGRVRMGGRNQCYST